MIKYAQYHILQRNNIFFKYGRATLELHEWMHIFSGAGKRNSPKQNDCLIKKNVRDI